MILETSAVIHPQQSHLSQHTGVVLTMVTLYGILSCYKTTLITNEHFSLAANAKYAGCIFLCVSPIWICLK